MSAQLQTLLVYTIDSHGSRLSDVHCPSNNTRRGSFQKLQNSYFDDLFRVQPLRPLHDAFPNFKHPPALPGQLFATTRITHAIALHLPAAISGMLFSLRAAYIPRILCDRSYIASACSC